MQPFSALTVANRRISVRSDRADYIHSRVPLGHWTVLRPPPHAQPKAVVHPHQPGGDGARLLDASGKSARHGLL